MTTRRHTSVAKAPKSQPSPKPSTESIRAFRAAHERVSFAISMLRITVCCMDADDGALLEDVRAADLHRQIQAVWDVIDEAKNHLFNLTGDERSAGDCNDLFDVLDLLTLAEFATRSEPFPQSNVTSNPMLGSLGVIAAQLERFAARIAKYADMPIPSSKAARALSAAAAVLQ